MSNTTTPKPFVFVLMRFAKEFDDIYKFGIVGAAADVGAYAERVDKQIFDEGVLERIYNQISKADVIVADMTGQSANVFYEVGYAHALGKIVLLLTQNADDIPFDLKHRPHIVYGGSIDQLRNELIPRLTWAIGEAKRHGKAENTERLSLRINDVPIPETNAGGSIPTLTYTFSEDARHGFVNLTCVFRNDSAEGSPMMTHAYLFTHATDPMIPQELDGYNSRPPDSLKFKRIQHYSADALDCPDGLNRQYVLEWYLPSLPPAAIETHMIRLPEIVERYRSTQKQPFGAKSAFRLRLHSPSQYHEYRFNVKIEIKPVDTNEPSTPKADDSGA